MKQRLNSDGPKNGLTLKKAYQEGRTIVFIDEAYLDPGQKFCMLVKKMVNYE